MTKMREGNGYWWIFLKDRLKQKKEKGEALLTLDRKVPNKILEIGEDYYKVRSAKGHKDRKITREKVEYVLRIVIKEGYFDSKVAEKYGELMHLDREFGANTSIIRPLLAELPFINHVERSGIAFSAGDFDKDKWGIEI